MYLFTSLKKEEGVSDTFEVMNILGLMCYLILDVFLPRVSRQVYCIPAGCLTPHTKVVYFHFRSTP